LTLSESLSKESFIKQVAADTREFSDPIKDSLFIVPVNDTIVYVNICSDMGSYKEFVKQKVLLEKASVLLLDMRGYPRDYTISLLSHLINSTVSLGNLKRPSIFFPDHKYDHYVDVEKWQIAPALSAESDEFSKKYEYGKPEKFHLSAKLYFYAAESSMSFSETLLEMINHYGVGIIVGDYTSGCNGDATLVQMPFAPFTMTINKFMFRDGSQHHGVGIKPHAFIANDDVAGIDTQIWKIIKQVYGE